MATAQTLINQSLRILGVIGAGETPTGEDSADALTALNSLITSLSLQKLMAYVEVQDSKALTPGTASYTIGTSGSPDWSTSRPLKVTSAFLRVGINDYPVDVITRTTYDSYVDKTVQSSMPNRAFYDATYPNGTIYLYPVPSAANTLYIRSLKVLESFASLGDAVDLPSGYERMMKFALARELSPEYGKPVSQDIERLYMESMADLKRINAQPIFGNLLELTGSNRYNIYTDQGA